ncbi:MAG: hypothetical protein ABH838_05060 [Actinomycetota bacterium]
MKRVRSKNLLFMIVLATLLIVAPMIIGGCKQGNGSDAGSDTEKEETKEVDPYEGWLTYTNEDVGYQLRYPPDWIVEEHSEDDAGIPGAKYITIKNSDDSFFVAFGLRGVGDTFPISGRTGLGVGESVEEGAIIVLGENVKIYFHVYEGKAKTTFFGKWAGMVTIGDHEMWAEFSGTGPYDELDVSTSPDLENAKKILESLELI